MEMESWLEAYDALYQNSLDQLKHVVEKYGIHNLHDPDEWDPTPLFIAVKDQHLWAVEYLLSQGMSMFIVNLFDDTAFHIAAKYYSLEMIKIFYHYGMNINMQGQDNSTPLNYAVRFKNYDVAIFLMQKGAAIDIRDDTGGTAASHIKHSNHPELLNLLDERLKGKEL